MQPQFPPSGEGQYNPAPVYPDTYQAWPTQPEPAPAWSPSPLPQLPVPGPHPQPQRSKASLFLGGALVLTLVALVISIVAGVNSHKGVVEERDALQTTVDARKATDADQRKQFTDADMANKYRKVLTADEDLETAFERWISAPDNSEEERVAANAWDAARKNCLKAVTDYQRAAQPYPPEWFSSLAPNVVDMTRADTDCWYRD